MSKSKASVKKPLKRRAVIVALPKTKRYFPSYSRVIPEISLEAFALDRWVLVGFASGVLLMFVIVLGVDLNNNMLALDKVKEERVRQAKEIAYWEDIVKKYSNYRDGYFKLALLTYQLGEKDEARVYLQKALVIDPNFAEGRALEESIAD